MVLWDCSTVTICRLWTLVPWGHRFPTSTRSRIADCSGLPPMRGLKGLRISFGSFPFRRTQIYIYIHRELADRCLEVRWSLPHHSKESSSCSTVPGEEQHSRPKRVIHFPKYFNQDDRMQCCNACGPVLFFHSGGISRAK